MRILLLGANGQVGWELRQALADAGELIASSRQGAGDLQLDIADLDRLERTLDNLAPDVIVNAAAYTAVDQAEQEPDLALRLNGRVPALLGAWAAQHNALVVHYSTDYVFDGTKDAPYVESDIPNPVNVYGRSKLAGDEALLASGCATIILRVSWVYGRRGSNFLLTMQRLMQERDELRIVDDQHGAPTWCRQIARTTAGILDRIPAAADARKPLCGLYHLSPTGATTWYGFATEIRNRLEIDCTLIPIPSADYPTPAQRPENSRLDAARLIRTFEIQVNPWQDDLAHCLRHPA